MALRIAHRSVALSRYESISVASPMHALGREPQSSYTAGAGGVGGRKTASRSSEGHVHSTPAHARALGCALPHVCQCADA
eukprot:12553533-Alexandrium_andersonii.AAC.1